MIINSPIIGNYPISQEFGGNAAAYAQFGLKGHNGIDIACPINTPVYSVGDGTVIKTGYDEGGYGHYVKVQYSGYSAIYAHLAYRMVEVGQVVQSGQVIARTGNSGNSTGPHLHFEVRPDNEPKNNGYNGAVDPLKYAPIVAEDNENAAKMIVKLSGLVVSEIGVRVRSGPGTNYPQVGMKAYNDKVKIKEIYAKELWGMVGEDQWCAIRYDDEEIIRIEDDNECQEPNN